MLFVRELYPGQFFSVKIEIEVCVEDMERISSYLAINEFHLAMPPLNEGAQIHSAHS